MGLARRVKNATVYVAMEFACSPVRRQSALEIFED
jgi:hypothetical protein